jgi:hypothetical protein
MKSLTPLALRSVPLLNIKINANGGNAALPFHFMPHAKGNCTAAYFNLIKKSMRFAMRGGWGLIEAKHAKKKKQAKDNIPRFAHLN